MGDSGLSGRGLRGEICCCCVAFLTASMLIWMLPCFSGFVIFPNKATVNSAFLPETFFSCFVELFPTERQVVVYLHDFSIWFKLYSMWYKF